MPYIGYAFILLICIEIILASLGKVNPKAFPYLLYGTALGMVLMTTLAGPYLVGSDIHLEYYFANYYGQTGMSGPILMVAPQGTSIANSIVAAHLPWDAIWTYKLFYPILFSTTPVLLYFIACKWLEPKQALLSSFLFIAFTPFYLEVPSIAREMLAETALVVILWAMLSMNSKKKYIVVVVCGALIPLSHYSIAVVSIVLFGVALLIGLFLHKLRLPLTLVLLAIIGVSACYFPFAQEGAVLSKLGHLYNNYVPYELRLKHPMFELVEVPQDATPKKKGRVNIGENPDPSVFIGWTEKSVYDRYDTLMDITLGADLLETNVVGKAFRISQWALLILTIPGLWFIRKEKTYWVLSSGFILITLLCLAPGWAGTLNVTRFAHITLMMGSIPIARSLQPRYMMPILVIYFLLSSGFAFEITQQPNIQTLTVPYNIGLSNPRIDLGASTTSDDLEVRDYIIENELYPINSDCYGAALLDERIGPLGPRSDIHSQLSKTPRPINGYVFIRSRNAWDNTFVVWRDLGMRTYYSMNEWLDPYDFDTIYQSGDAKVILLK